jgi:hypothetical protein
MVDMWVQAMSGPCTTLSPQLRLVQVVEDSAEAGLEQALLEGLSCPISFQLMADPVVADDGHTYERPVIQQWIDKCTAGEPPSTGEMSPNSCLLCVMHDADREDVDGCFALRVHGADGRPVTSPLTGAAMGRGLKPNLLARSMLRNLVRTNT